MRGKRSTVILFVGGLPTHVSITELKSFIRTKLNAAQLKTKMAFSGPVGDCSILRLTDAKTGSIEFHALIEIRPAELAIRAIDILNRTEFKGNPLATHRYRQRSPLGRRQTLVSGQHNDRQEKPQKEERRSTLQIDLVEPNPPTLAAFCGLRGQ